MHEYFNEKQENSTSCCCNSDKLSNILTKYSQRPTSRQSSDQEIKHNSTPNHNKSMAVKGGISLINFFVFNSEYGPREGEVSLYKVQGIMPWLFKNKRSFNNSYS